MPAVHASRYSAVLLALLFFPSLTFAQTGRVEGTVFQEGLGNRLSGVNVTVEGTGRGAATGGRGTFKIEEVPVGTYTLAASAVGYKTQRISITVGAGEVTSVTFQLEERPVELSEVVVERVTMTGGLSGVLDIPGSAHYISPRTLDRYSYNDVHRVLRDVPGINLQEEDGYGLRPNIGMRGAGSERSSKITVMEDGVLIAPAPYAAPAAYYFPTVGRMQGVEVRKGSSQIKYGPYTTGGALNLISTQIPDDFSGHAELLAGEYGDRTVHAYVGDAFSRFGYLVETFQARTDGFKRLDGGGDTGFDKKDYLVKFRLNTRPAARLYQALTFKVGQTTETSDETYLGLTDDDFERAPYRRYAGSQQDLMETEHRQYQVRHVIRPHRKVDVTTTLYRTEFSRNWYKLDRVRAGEDGERLSIAGLLENPAPNPEAYAIITGQTSPNDNALEVKANNRAYYAQGIQSVAGFQFGAAPAVEHELELGVRYHEDEEDRFQWVDLYRIDAGVMKLTEAGTPGTESNRVGRARALAAFGQYRIRLGRVTALPGLRYENILLTRDDYGSSDPERTGVALTASRNRVDVFIPGIGIDYAFTDNLRTFAGVHRGFAPPGAKEGAAPEASINYEVGARYRKGVSNLGGIFFFNDYSNLLGADLAASGGQGAGRLFNGGAVNVVGFEFSAGHNLGRLGRWQVSVPVSLAYTFTDAEFQNAFESEYEPWGTVAAGDKLPYLPRHQVGASLGLEGARFGLDLSTKYVGRMRTAAGQGDFPRAQRTDPHLVLDLAAEYAFARHARLFAAVRNLTDEVYVVARRPAGVRPGLPRTFLIGLKTDF